MEKTKRKILHIAASLFMATAVFLSGLLSGCAKQGADSSAPTSSGAELRMRSASDDVSLTAEKIAPESFENYGISTIAANAYTITATATLEDGSPCPADFQQFAFQTLTYESGGSVPSSVMTVSQKSKNTFLLTYVRAFSQRIIFTVQSAVNTAKKGTLYIDCARPLATASLIYNGGSGWTAIENSYDIRNPLMMYGWLKKNAGVWSSTWIFQFPDIADKSKFTFSAGGNIPDEVIWYRIEGKFSEDFVSTINSNFKQQQIQSDWSTIYASDSDADKNANQVQICRAICSNAEGSTNSYQNIDYITSQPSSCRTFCNLLDSASKPLELRFVYHTKYKAPMDSAALILWQISFDVDIYDG